MRDPSSRSENSKGENYTSPLQHDMPGKICVFASDDFVYDDNKIRDEKMKLLEVNGQKAD